MFFVFKLSFTLIRAYFRYWSCVCFIYLEWYHFSILLEAVLKNFILDAAMLRLLLMPSWMYVYAFMISFNAQGLKVSLTFRIVQVSIIAFFLISLIIIPVCELDYFIYVRSLICIAECIGKIVLTILSENANYIIL